MEYQIVVKKRFAGNLLKLLLYLEKEWGKKVADEFTQKILDTIKLLKLHPYVGAPSKKIPGARGILISSHNRLFYRIVRNKIIVITLADTRRKRYRS